MIKRMTDLSSLADATSGVYRCERVNAKGLEALRIKRMGLCEGLVVEVLGAGDPMILRVGHSRLGLSRLLARTIQVISVDDRVAGD